MKHIEVPHEYILEKLYSKEPLAAAILSYLNTVDPDSFLAIMDRFDQFGITWIQTDIKNFINDHPE